jgi:putative polyhydroxyalkanoate system protein
VAVNPRRSWRRELGVEKVASIEIRKRHGLGAQRARTLVEELAKELKHKLGGEYRWEGDILEFKRTGASGCIRVDEEEVEIQVRLGILLRPMKEPIEDAVHRYLRKALA